MGGDSCSECRGFEPQYRRLDGNLSHYFAAKIEIFHKNKRKRGRGRPLFTLKKCFNLFVFTPTTAAAVIVLRVLASSFN